MSFVQTFKDVHLVIFIINSTRKILMFEKNVHVRFQILHALIIWWILYQSIFRDGYIIEYDKNNKK
jgi:hypothetical protein